MPGVKLCCRHRRMRSTHQGKLGKKCVNLALKNYNIKRTQKNGWENGLLILMIAVNSTVILGQI